jgi:hypothetical protein
MLIKNKRQLLLSIILFLLSSCIVEYVPSADEEQELLVVDGMITDQPGINSIRLAKSIPIWKNPVAKPLKGCIVTISDDLGYTYSLKETRNGIYITDPIHFQGVIGRKYSLHIRTTSEPVNYSYRSLLMEMKSVPPIDSIYYEKKTYQQETQSAEGCQIYLDTHDPSKNCKFFRWEYSETWEIHIPYNVTNRVCWSSNNSSGIFIKNSSVLGEDRIIRFPIISITNPIDKLSVKYSILVNQFSMNEDEYLYWERLKNTLEQIGGLYDQVPTIIPNNIICVEDPNRKVLGYFSVSAVSSRRLFIKDKFNGYDESCNSDIKFGLPKFDWDIRSPSYGTDTSIVGLDATVWVAEDHTDEIPPYRILVHTRWCSDCTKKGIFGEYRNIKPSFWDDDK